MATARSLLGLLLVGVVAGCGGSSSDGAEAAASPGKVMFSGTVQVQFINRAAAEQQFKVQGTSCIGTGSFSEVKQGTQVTITDAAGAIVGSTELEQGRPDLSGGSDEVFKNFCRFGFRADVAPADFYTVKVLQYEPVIVKRADAGAALVALGG